MWGFYHARTNIRSHIGSAAAATIRHIQNFKEDDRLFLSVLSSGEINSTNAVTSLTTSPPWISLPLSFWSLWRDLLQIPSKPDASKTSFQQIFVICWRTKTGRTADGKERAIQSKTDNWVHVKVKPVHKWSNTKTNDSATSSLKTILKVHERS